MNVIENTLELHPAVAPVKRLIEQPHLLPHSAAGCSSFSPWSARQGGASRRRNAAAGRRGAAAHSTTEQLPGRYGSLPETAGKRRSTQADASGMARAAESPAQITPPNRGLFTHRFC
jgi:hypothetical protein